MKRKCGFGAGHYVEEYEFGIKSNGQLYKTCKACRERVRKHQELNKESYKDYYRKHKRPLRELQWGNKGKNEDGQGYVDMLEGLSKDTEQPIGYSNSHDTFIYGCEEH